jgi:hypothetical protein
MNQLQASRGGPGNSPWRRVAATRDLPHNRLFPGRRRCCDVAYLCQAFSQHTGPGAIMDKSGHHFVARFP